MLFPMCFLSLDGAVKFLAAIRMEYADSAL